MNPPPPSSERAADIRRGLLSHYDRSRRDLPWRGETDPYRILVSEVMLQQTRVETVKEYYGAWLERFPDVESLAAAAPDEVLKAWEGLGYYRRARNLHATAIIIREQLGGRLPQGNQELRNLPGVGEYTAGAVSSIAFGERVPAVDGNVRRVLSRLFDVPDPRGRWLRDVAGSLVDAERPGDWNQALMELGATICSPRGPSCDDCPIECECAARAAGTQDERPTRRAKKSIRETAFVLAVVRHGGRVMVTRRPSDGLLGGLWAFPEVELRPGQKPGDALGALLSTLGLGGSHEVKSLPTVTHRFTHLVGTYLPRLVDVPAIPVVRGGEWLDPTVPTELAFPVAQQRVLRSVTELDCSSAPRCGARWGEVESGASTLRDRKGDSPVRHA